MLVHQSGTPTWRPVLIKQVFDILASLQFSHQTLCRSQILAVDIFYLLYVEHGKYYTKISWGKSCDVSENDL